MRFENCYRTIALLLIAFLFIWPLSWVVMASFDEEAPLNIAWPENFTLQNYRDVFSEPMNYRSFLNSFLLSFSQGLIVVALSVLAAYPLSRFQLKHKTKIMLGMLFLTGLPMTAIMVPVYMMFFTLKITNSLIATTLFLSATALPYSIWMMKNFMDIVPKDLEESALIDGASLVQIVLKIILPCIMPGLCVVFIFTFAGTWGNFFVPFILLNSVEKMPASVSIFQFFSAYDSVVYGPLAAFSLLYTLPVAILYVLAQKFMAQGFALDSAVK